MPISAVTAGVAPHPDYPLDGASLLRVLEAPSDTFERELFWRMKFREQKAVRTGNWKWLSIEGHEYLFDLAKDQRERANLAKRNPERVAALRDRYRQWEATLPPIPEDAKVSARRTSLSRPSRRHAAWPFRSRDLR